MRFLLWFLLLGIIAALVALIGKHNEGYVLLAAPPWRLELSLNLLILGLPVVFVVLYLLTRLIIRTIGLPEQVQLFRKNQNERRARQKQDAAVLALLEGRFGKAHQLSVEALAIPGSSGLSAVIAARAALDVRAFDVAEGFLDRPDAQVSSLTIVRLMMEAEAQMEKGQPREALRILQDLRKEAGLHTAALRLQLRALQVANRWDEIPAVLDQLVKRKVFEPAHAEHARVHARSEQLMALATEPQGLRDYWNRVPEADRIHPNVARAAALSFLQLGADSEAADIVAKSLDQEWDSELVVLYARCKLTDTVAQIERAEKWLRQHNQEASLLLVLGLLCQRQQLWGKAQTYLEASVAVENTHSAHLALGELLGRLGKSDEANAHFSAALRLALDQLKSMAGGAQKAGAVIPISCRVLINKASIPQPER